MKLIISSVVIVVILIGGALMLGGNSNGGTSPDREASKNNVSTVNGVQVIEILARGGYSPRVTTAEADLPTILKVRTDNTFDCSAALTVPSVGYRKILSRTEEVEIEIPPQEAGSILQGLCSMGMYSFEVKFI